MTGPTIVAPTKKPADPIPSPLGPSPLVGPKVSSDLFEETRALLRDPNVNSGWRHLHAPRGTGLIVEISFGADFHLYTSGAHTNADLGNFIALTQGQALRDVTATIRPNHAAQPTSFEKCRAFPILVRAYASLTDFYKLPALDSHTALLSKDTEVVLRNLRPETIFAIGLFQASGDMAQQPLWEKRLSQLRELLATTQD